MDAFLLVLAVLLEQPLLVLCALVARWKRRPQPRSGIQGLVPVVLVCAALWVLGGLLGLGLAVMGIWRWAGSADGSGLFALLNVVHVLVWIAVSLRLWLR